MLRKVMAIGCALMLCAGSAWAEGEAWTAAGTDEPQAISFDAAMTKTPLRSEALPDGRWQEVYGDVSALDCYEFIWLLMMLDYEPISLHSEEDILSATLTKEDAVLELRHDQRLLELTLTYPEGLTLTYDASVFEQEEREDEGAGRPRPYVQVRCDYCYGQGTFRCLTCNGRGYIEGVSSINTPSGQTRTYIARCPQCDGKTLQRCFFCDGLGYRSVPADGYPW